MRYLFYEHGELVAELDKCTVVSAADDAGVSTVLFNGKTYQRRKPVEFVQEWVAFDLVNKWAPSPVIPFDSLPADAKPSNPFKGLKYHIGNAAEFWMKECHSWRDAFERLESDVERLRNDKIVANGLIANLEGLAAADGEKIRDLESRLETVAASRERSIDDYNKSVAREGRLREEIQRINLRLADAEHERVRLRKQLDGQREIAGIENGQLRRALADAREQLHTMAATAAPPIVIPKSDYGAALRAEIERLSTEVIDLTKQRDEARSASEFVHNHYVLASKQRDDANKANAALRDEVDAALKERDQWRAEAQGLQKVVYDRNEALNEARIDESRSTQDAERYQRKLYEIDQIIKK